MLASPAPCLGNPSSATKLLFAALAASNGNLDDAIVMLARSRAAHAKGALSALKRSKAAKIRQGYVIDGTWTMGRMAAIEIGFSATIPGTFAAYDDAYHAAEAAKRAVTA